MIWTVHLATHAGRRKAGFVVAVILCAMAAAHLALGGVIPAVAMGLVLVAAVGDFLFPVTYKITSEAASSRSLFSHQIIKWKDVKACYLSEDGVKVSPLSKRTRFEAYRGVFLRFPVGDDRRRESGKMTAGDVLIAIRSIWGRDIR